MITKQPHKRFMLDREMKVVINLRHIHFSNEVFDLTPAGLMTHKPGSCGDGASPVWKLPIIGYFGPWNGPKDIHTGLPTLFPATHTHDKLLEYRKELGITADKCHEIFCEIVNRPKTRFPRFLKPIYCWFVVNYGPQP